MAAGGEPGCFRASVAIPNAGFGSGVYTVEVQVGARERLLGYAECTGSGWLTAVPGVSFGHSFFAGLPIRSHKEGRLQVRRRQAAAAVGVGR